MTIEDLRSMKGVHQSRNSYVARTLREIGYMRELGEGMRRIHELMKSNELAPPAVLSDNDIFSLTLFHRAMYSQDELLWLEQYSGFGLSAEQKAIVLLGRRGSLIAPQDIWDRLGLIDTEHYRRLLSSLQVLGILVSEKAKGAAQNTAKREKIPVRAVPRFKIKLAKDAKSQSPDTKRKKAREHEFVRPVPASDKVQLASEEEETIFVSNLPDNVNDRDMVAAFESFGVIERVFVPKNGPHSRGYGFVSFETVEQAQRLLREQPKVSMGPYSLVLRPARPRLKP